MRSSNKRSGIVKIRLSALWAGTVAAMMVALALPPHSEFAHSNQTKYTLATNDVERLNRQSRLKRDLESSDRSRFSTALAALSNLDEEGALDVWKVAIGNLDSTLRAAAWTIYRQVWPRLSRNERVPEVVRFNTKKEAVTEIAETAGVSANVFSEDGTGCTARLAPYSVGRLDRAGLPSTILYASLSEMEDAARGPDPTARKLVSDYRASIPNPAYQVRIAVVDLSRNTKPYPGYSNWLGDPEDIVMRNGPLVAYLDVFASDGSRQSISSHIEQRYTRRGYALQGFFTTNEFSSNVARFFPGRSFPAGRQDSGLMPESAAPLQNGAFHSYAQALAECTSLAQNNPGIAEIVTLGSTYEGNEIFALKIASNPTVDDPSKPNVLITGCHHAREWISVEPPMYFANQLVNGYSTDDGIKYLVDHLQIWIVPVLNPDGLSFSQQSANDDLTAVRLWRKNMDPVYLPACGSGTGVDLNRNYDFEWRLAGDTPCPDYYDDVGASDDPLDDTFRGFSPDSELEVQAMCTLTGDPNLHFQSRLDYHNFDQLVLYPWGYQAGAAPDAANLGTLGTQIASLAAAVDGTVYTPEQSIDLYITTGTSTDYSYGANGTPAPYTIELPPTCCLFNVPESQIGPIDQEMWPGAEMLMNWSAGPPILQSVQAYQQGSDGAFSSQVYGAHWINSTGGRQLVIDVHAPALQTGPLQVQLQFSKPMDISLPFSGSLGTAAPFSQLTLA
ncbi:MAG TPA: M14 family metallopeptidase, partial [Blastocatellia bacterium]